MRVVGAVLGATEGRASIEGAARVVAVGGGAAGGAAATICATEVVGAVNTVFGTLTGCFGTLNTL